MLWWEGWSKCCPRVNIEIWILHELNNLSIFIKSVSEVLNLLLIILWQWGTIFRCKITLGLCMYDENRRKTRWHRKIMKSFISMWFKNYLCVGKKSAVFEICNNILKKKKKSKHSSIIGIFNFFCWKSIDNFINFKFISLVCSDLFYTV